MRTGRVLRRAVDRWAGIPAEVRLLLDCLSPQAGPPCQPERPAASFDWERLLRLGEQHGLLPLLDRYLEGSGIEVPEAVRLHLHRRARATAYRNLALTAELLRLLARLEAAGVVAAPFKGPVLAVSAYGDLGRRDFLDLDLLVRPPGIAAAERVLEAEGYRPEFALDPARGAELVATDCERAFVHPTRGAVVDLHWGFSHIHFRFPLRVDAVWTRLATATLGGRQVPTLGPEDTLLLLCAHGTKHLWARLIWVGDVAHTVAARPDLDWATLLGRARGLGCERMLLLGLHLARELTSAELPAAVQARIAGESAVRGLGDRVLAWLVRDELGTLEPFAGGRFHLDSRERWRDRLAYALRFATAPTVTERFVDGPPAALGFLLPVIRPIRLAGIYAPRLLHRRR